MSADTASGHSPAILRHLERLAGLRRGEALEIDGVRWHFVDRGEFYTALRAADGGSARMFSTVYLAHALDEQARAEAKGNP